MDQSPANEAVSGGRPTNVARALGVGALLLAAAWAAFEAPNANWDLPLFAILLAFSVVSDLITIEIEKIGQLTNPVIAEE